MRLFPSVLVLISILGTLTAFAQNEAVMLPSNGALADCAWDVHLSSLPQKERFETIRRAYEKNPADLSVKAHYARFLTLGKEVGGPENRVAEGLKLAKETTDEGNTTGELVLGLSYAYGIGTERNLEWATSHLHNSARAGNVSAMVRLGYAYFQESSLGSATSPSEFWYRLAAKRGNPSPLHALAVAYEKPRDGQPVSLSKAAGLFYEASIYGSFESFTYLKKVFKQKDAAPEMRRAACLSMLWHATLGDSSLQGPRVKEAALELEKLCPEDPVALVALGCIYRSREFFMDDMKKAAAFFEKASALGSDDARCELASMQAEGLGIPANPGAALATWRELEKKGHPGSLAALGYYSYWGSLKHDGLPKDEKTAYAYSRRAAAAGDLFGQHNVTLLFSHGIGTEKNYLLAVLYSYAAARRGYKHDQKELPKLITAAFD